MQGGNTRAREARRNPRKGQPKRRLWRVGPTLCNFINPTNCNFREAFDAMRTMVFWFGAVDAAHKLVPANFSDLLTATQRFTGSRCLAAVVVTLWPGHWVWFGRSAPRSTASWLTKYSFSFFVFTYRRLPRRARFPKSCCSPPRRAPYPPAEMENARPAVGPTPSGSRMGSAASAISTQPTRHTAAPCWPRPAFQFPWLSLVV